MENNLYKQAILDAKAIRAGAIANAKASLEEVIGPKINELVRLNLQEDLEEDLDVTEEGYDMEEGMEEEGYDMEKEGSENLMEDSELDEILAELNSLEEESLEESFDYLSEADDEDADDEEADTEVDDTDEDETDDEVDETPTDDTKVVDITLGDLKDILQSVMSGKSSTGMEFSGDESDSDQEDLNLDEILAELNEGGDDTEMTPEEAAKKLDQIAATLEESTVMSVWEAFSNLNSVGGYSLSQEAANVIGQFVIKLFGLFGAGLAAGTNEKVQDAIKKGYTGLMDFIKSKSKFAYSALSIFLKKHKKDIDAASKKDSTKDKELNEARKTIKSLSSTLNEVNLLNAKLLYVNKIFKERSLNESQKLKVIKSFDKATTAKEAKNVYEILKESLNTKQKTSLKESIGFASQSRGYIKNNNIIESDPFVSRWQKIAGIKN